MSDLNLSEKAYQNRSDAYHILPKLLNITKLSFTYTKTHTYLKIT